MTHDEWLALDKFAVVQYLGVNYRVDGCDGHPGAYYGCVTLTAYRQKPHYHIYVLPNDPKIAKMHYIGDWKTDQHLREIR